MRLPFIWDTLHKKKKKKMLVNTCKLYLFNSFYPFYAFNFYDFMTMNTIEQ